MRLFDLLFIACFLATTCYVLGIGWALVRRRQEIAWRRLKRAGIFLATYFLVLITVSLVSPQHMFHVGDTRCFDDWCMGVSDAKPVDSIAPLAAPRGRFLLVTLRISSQARRIRQSEPATQVYLLDAGGRRYEVDEAAQRAFEDANGKQLPIGAMLDPGGSFTTVRLFDIPRDLKEIGLASHQVGRRKGPGFFIIGDDSSFLHKPAVFKIPIPAGDQP